MFIDVGLSLERYIFDKYICAGFPQIYSNTIEIQITQF